MSTRRSERVLCVRGSGGTRECRTATVCRQFGTLSKSQRTGTIRSYGDPRCSCSHPETSAIACPRSSCLTLLPPCLNCLGMQTLTFPAVRIRLSPSTKARFRLRLVQRWIGPFPSGRGSRNPLAVAAPRVARGLRPCASCSQTRLPVRKRRRAEGEEEARHAPPPPVQDSAKAPEGRPEWTRRDSNPDLSLAGRGGFRWPPQAD